MSVSQKEFFQKTPTGETSFLFDEEYLTYSFKEKGTYSSQEVYYNNIAPGLFKHRKRKDGWLLWLIVSTVLTIFAVTIIKDGDLTPMYFIRNPIPLVAVFASTVFFFHQSLEDYWLLRTYVGLNILILDTDDREKIYAILKDMIGRNKIMPDGEGHVSIVGDQPDNTIQ